MTAPQHLPLGTRIKLVRIVAGLSQRALAARLDMPPSTMSSIETGVKLPSESQMRAICSALGVTRGEIQPECA